MDACGRVKSKCQRAKTTADDNTRYNAGPESRAGEVNRCWTLKDGMSMIDDIASAVVFSATSQQMQRLWATVLEEKPAPVLKVVYPVLLELGVCQEVHASRRHSHWNVLYLACAIEIRRGLHNVLYIHPRKRRVARHSALRCCGNAADLGAPQAVCSDELLLGPSPWHKGAQPSKR